MALPPALAAGAHYDRLLQSALERFFPRAVLETEASASVSSMGRLALEPTADPAALALRWFGMRHVLRAPADLPFTPHEVRLARAIGTVLWARYRAILEPSLMVSRSDLFQGAIDDRYIGAFLDESSYALDDGPPHSDRVAAAIELLRVAALSSYENRPISSGVLLLDADLKARTSDTPGRGGVVFSQGLTTYKAFYRVSDGVRTVFLVNRDGVVLDVVDVARWVERTGLDTPDGVPCASAVRAHALATRGTRDVCVVLSPSHEIKVFAEGAEVFAFRHAQWHLLDLRARFERWASAVNGRTLAERTFRTALDLADARQGALFVVLDDVPRALAELIAPAHRVADLPTSDGEPLSRQQLLSLLASRSALEIDPSVLAAIATMDGATVMDQAGRLIAVGAILLHPSPERDARVAVAEGARTTAALAASRFGAVLKVSEDGLITFYEHERKVWDI